MSVSSGRPTLALLEAVTVPAVAPDDPILQGLRDGLESVIQAATDPDWHMVASDVLVGAREHDSYGYSHGFMTVAWAALAELRANGAAA